MIIVKMATAGIIVALVTLVIIVISYFRVLPVVS